MALKITDATKDDFLQFFATDVRGINCKPYFEIWLSKKRWEELSDAYDTALKASQVAFQQYMEFMKKSVAEKDFDKKVHYCMKADEKMKLHEKYEAEIERLEAKQNKMLEGR